MGERPVINVVYEHLQQHEMHAVHRGDITVIASSLPMQGCDIYAYANAYSFRGKQKGLDVLLLFEPIVVLPGQYDKQVWDRFDYIFTLYDALIERDPGKFRKVPLFRTGWIVDAPVTENMEERIRKYSLDNRRNAICLINGNKRSSVPSELYSKRVEAALWFHLFSDIPFDVYGNPPFTLPNYKGVLGPDEKFFTLSQYRYCLAFENTNHPDLSRGYVEKILDCLETRTIPIYLGCPNIEDYVPQNCFIDIRRFKNHRDLDDFLHAMDKRQYESYIRNIDAWVSQGGLRPYSMHAIYTQLSELYASHAGKDVFAFFCGANAWERGLAPSLSDRQQVFVRGTPCWSYEQLAKATSPLIDYSKRGPELSPDIDARLKKARQFEKMGKFTNAAQEIEAILSGGVFNADILYQYAQILIANAQYEEGLEQLLRVVMLDPGRSLALNDIGALHTLKKNYKQAVQYLLAAVQVDIHNYSALENLLSLLMNLGLNEYALQFTQSLLTQLPDDAQVRDILKKYNLPAHRIENQPPLVTLKRIKSPTFSLSAEFLSELSQLFHADVFVETGTFMGGTTLEAARIFRSVHTIELSEELYGQALARFAGRENTHAYQGDSGKLFPGILKKIDGRIIFWLDGHYSEGVTAKSEKNTPILKELEAIKRANITDAIILIDDFRMFPNSWTRIPERASLRDYPTIPQLLRAIRDINSAYAFVVLGDVLIAYSSRDNFRVSPVVAACTISRLFDGADGDVQKVINAERTIGTAAGEELAVLQDLHALTSPEMAGLGEHYRLWYALTLLERQQYAEACRELQAAVAGGFNHWRIHWYLGQATYKSSNLAAAFDELQEVLRIVPNFGDAQTLLKELLMRKRLLKKNEDVLSQLRSAGLWRDNQPLRLHLGCGENHFEGYINIDYPPAEHSVQTVVVADLFADITLLEFPEGSVDEIRLHHVFEHFGRSKALALLIRWHSWLKVGGKLHIETPDIIGSSRTLISDKPYRTKQAVLRHAFGSHEASWAYHLDGWYNEKFEHVLSKFGFAVQCQNQQWNADPWLSNVHALAVKQRTISRDDLLKIADEVLIDSMVADVPAERLMHQVWCDMVRTELNRKSPDMNVPDLSGQSVRTMDMDHSPHVILRLTNLSIKADSPDLDETGFDVTDSAQNGEFAALSSIIRAGDIVFDVGANKGNWSKQVLSIKPGIRLFAFEPVPGAYDVLRQGLQGPNAAVFNMAISNEDGEKTFYHYANNSEVEELSSFYRRPDVEKGLKLKVIPITVKSRTLDSFCREQGVTRIDLLKIDVEGGELDVLKGASELLQTRCINIIQFEYGGTFKDAHITLRQIYELLIKCGYHVYRIIPDGLVSIGTWRDALENYRYSNYLTVLPLAENRTEAVRTTGQSIDHQSITARSVHNAESAEDGKDAVAVSLNRLLQTQQEENYQAGIEEIKRLLSLSSDKQNINVLQALIKLLMHYKSRVPALNLSSIINDLYKEGFYNIHAGKPLTAQKKALVIYVSEAVPWIICGKLNEFAQLNNHSMWWETGEMLRLLNKYDFSVDWIGLGSEQYLDYKFGWDKYDLIIDGGTNNLCKSPSYKGQVKVFYSTGMYWLQANLAEMNRIIMFQKRHGILMPQDRMQNSNFSDECADYMTYFGNESLLDGYSTKCKIISLNISSAYVPEPESKDIERSRKNFIWLGGQAMIHKGLDLVVDAFREMPEYTLHIVAIMHTEKRFQTWLKPILERHKNIILHGSLNVASPQFTELAWNSIGTAYVSAAEGGPGSVAQLLHFGIIPVVTKSSNVRAEKLGYIIEEDNDHGIIQGIQKYVRAIAAAPREELRSKCEAIQEYARTYHTRDAYSKSFESALKVFAMPLSEKNITIIFSKDRAMQLDCTLRSFFLHCSDPDNTQAKVLYKSSTQFHENQYQALKQAYPAVEFIAERNFRNDLLSLLNTGAHVLFLVDDNIIVRDFSIQDSIDSLKLNPTALGFSLRLGKNTIYCYMLGKQQNLPVFTLLDKGVLRYNWMTAELDFGYPLELSSSIYRVADIKPLVDRIDFRDPNTLELLMETNKAVFSDTKPDLLCFEQSVAFCNPVNMVQSMWVNKAGMNSNYTVEKLSDLFHQGYRIDAGRFSGFVPNSCHQEVEFEFARESVPAEVQQQTAPQNVPVVTIGIPNYNGIQHIQLCLESIRRNTPEPHEVIVVDNGSTDGSKEYLRNQAGIVLVENQDNVGAPGARNQFMSIAKGDYIVFLDNDTIVAKGWIKKLIGHMESDAQIGIIGACSNYATGLQGIPNVTYKTLEKLEEYARRREQEHRGELVPSPRLISFCVFIRRAAINKIGAMETGFSKFCFEDDDYSLRITIAGFKSVVANDVFIHHTGGPQGRGDKQYNKWLYDAWDGFKRKWGLPKELPFGSSYDVEKIVSRTFDPEVHFIPLPDRVSVEELIFAYPHGKPITDISTSTGQAVQDRHEDNNQVVLFDALQGAREFHHKDQIDKAVERLIEGIKFCPEEKAIYHALAEILIDAKRFTDALEALNSLPEDAKEEPKSLVLVGYCKHGMNLLDEAQEYADRALSLHTDFALALNLKGMIAFKKGGPGAAESFFKRAIESDPGYGEPYTNLAELKWAVGEKQEALDLFEKGFVLSPAVSDTLSLYQTAVTELGEFARAEKVLGDARSLYPKHKKLAFAFISALLAQGKNPEAMESIEQALITFGIDDGILNAALSVRDRIGPMEISKAASTKGTLSVCMIAKNEEEHIARCLMSLKPVSDESIVVDTGSTDRTKDIAKVFGAKVYDLPWTNDFSAARNFSLSKATGDWILVMDGDEVISPVDYAAVRELTKKSAKPVAYSFVTRNYVEFVGMHNWEKNDSSYGEEVGTGWIRSPKVRLFPNDNRIRFENPVHELVDGAAERAGLEIITSIIPIHHYGKMDKEKRAKKGEMYLELGKAKLRDLGNSNPKALWELAVQEFVNGSYKNALDRFIEILGLDHSLLQSDPKLSNVYMQVGICYMCLNKYREAITPLQKALELDPDLKEAHVNSALASIYFGQASAAVTSLEKVYKIDPGFPNCRYFLAVSYLCSGRQKQGLALIKSFEKDRIAFAELLAIMTKELLVLGRRECAVSVLEALDQNSMLTPQLTSILNECRTKDEKKISSPGRKELGNSDAVLGTDSPAMTKMTAGLTSIIILTLNQLDYIKRCLTSIRKHTLGPHEIIFVDNGSTKGTLKWLRQQVTENPGYKLVENTRNTGWAKGFNQGMLASSREYVLLMSDDVIVTREWLIGMMECATSAPTIGIVGPMTVNVEGPQSVIDRAYQSVDVLDTFADTFRTRNRHRRIPSVSLSSVCVLLKRAVIEKVGLLDEALAESDMAFEDYCNRVSLEGFNAVIAGDVFVHNDNKVPVQNRGLLKEKWSGIEAGTELGKKLARFNALQGALEFHRKDQIDKAVGSLIDGLKFCPEEKAIYHALAEILIDAKRFTDALEALNSLPEQAKEEPKSLALVGYGKEGMGLVDEAEAYADSALSLQPGYPVALNLKGMLASKRGDGTAAEGFFRKAIESDPGYGEPYTNLGELKWAAGEKKEALDLFEKGFVLSPAVADTLSLYQTAVTELGEFARAEKVLGDARSIYPKHKKLAFAFISALLAQGKNPEAMESIEQTLITFGIDDGILNAALSVRDRIGPMEISKAALTKGTLSVCMIVKNEEEHIARCLMSLKPVADEMIVVDTGSTDRTKDIAKVFGAKVYDLPWTSDFSAARNFSLSKATGDWILVHDADEVISALDYDKLQRLLNQRIVKPTAYTLTTRNYTTNSSIDGWMANTGEYPQEEAGTGWFPTPKVRLFANNSRVRFQNPVHELLEPSLMKAGFTIKPCDIPIHHYGELNQEKDRSKAEMYYKLGKKKLETAENDSNALRELAIQAGELGKFEEAIDLFQKYIKIAPNDHVAYFNMSTCYLELGHFNDARNMAKKGIELAPDSKESLLSFSTASICTGDMQDAVSTLEKLLRRVPDYPPAMTALAAGYCIEGGKGVALDILNKMRTRGYDCSVALHSLAKKLIAGGRIEYTIRLLQGMIESRHIHEDTKSLLVQCEAMKNSSKLMDLGFLAHS